MSVPLYAYTNPSVYFAACAEKAKLEQQERHAYANFELQKEKMFFQNQFERERNDIMRYQVESQNANFQAQLNQQQYLTEQTNQNRLAVANIQANTQKELAEMNAEFDRMLEAQKSGNKIFEIAMQGISNDLSQLNAAMAQNWLDDQRHRRAVEMKMLDTKCAIILMAMEMKLKSKQETEAIQLQFNLSAIKSYLDSELSKAGLEHSKQCEIIADLVKKAVGLGTKEFSEDAIRQAVNKMMRETEPYTGY